MRSMKPSLWGRMIRKGAVSAMDTFAESVVAARETNHPHVAIMLQGIAALNGKEEIRHGK